MASDEEHSLVSRAQGGNQIAFQTLVEQHIDRLYGMLLRLAADPQDAEDLFQETVVRCYRQIGTFRREAAFGTWCTRIAINLAHDHFRRRKRLPELQNLREVETLWRDERYTVDPEKVALLTDDQATLNAALSRLPVTYRATLLLHDQDGYTMQEAAEMTGVKLPTAKARLRRARMALVTYLDRREVVPMTADAGGIA